MRVGLRQRVVLMLAMFACTPDDSAVESPDEVVQDAPSVEMPLEEQEPVEQPTRADADFVVLSQRGDEPGQEILWLHEDGTVVESMPIDAAATALWADDGEVVVRVDDHLWRVEDAGVLSELEVPPAFLDTHRPMPVGRGAYALVSEGGASVYGADGRELDGFSTSGVHCFVWGAYVEDDLWLYDMWTGALVRSVRGAGSTPEWAWEQVLSTDHDDATVVGHDSDQQFWFSVHPEEHHVRVAWASLPEEGSRGAALQPLVGRRPVRQILPRGPREVWLTVGARTTALVAINDSFEIVALGPTSGEGETWVAVDAW